jgi:uncharacterized protein YdhG (YjbR/CyaY superfamily)
VGTPGIPGGSAPDNRISVPINPALTMKSTITKNRKNVRQPANAADPIAGYARTQSAEHAAICQALRREIDAVLTRATSTIWHAMPVWFIDDNPIVGYKATARHVNLLFWSGQLFGEPALKAAGKFKAAQIQFTEAAQIDSKALRRWLKKSGREIWDYRCLRGAQSQSRGPSSK